MECDKIIEGVVYGHLPSGKNNYRISGSRMFKAAKISEYEYDFAKQIGSIKNRSKVKMPIEYDVGLTAKVYFRDHKRDLDTILFCDLLQKYGILKNDRQIKVKNLWGVEVDAKNPRVEFSIFKL